MFSVLLFLIIGGCAKKKLDSKPPIVQGHRISGVSHQPLQALQHAQKKGYPSVEIDVSLTADRVLIVHHDYWLSNEQCIREEERNPSEQIFVKDQTWEQLRQQTTCPSAMLSAQEFLSSPMLSSEVLVNIDVKYHPQFTQSKERFTKALIQLVSQYPHRKLMITASDLTIVRSLKQSLSIPVLLEYPFFSSSNLDHHNIAIALGAKLKIVLGMVRLVELVQQSNADGISLPFQIAALRDVKRLRENKMKIQLFTVNAPADAQKICEWPVDILISDLPESIPCFRTIPIAPH